MNAWGPVRSALTGEAPKPAGTVTLASDKAVSARDLVNVVWNGYAVAVDEAVYAAAAFASSKEHSVSISSADLDAKPGKSNAAAMKYSATVCRAGLFARLVSLVLARSGVRAAIVELLVDMLNTGITPAFSSDALAGKELCLALTGSASVQVHGSLESLAPASEALRLAALTPVALSASEAETLVKGQFLCTGATCLLAAAASNALKALDGVSAMACEALGASAETFAPEQYEIARQHRGQINCALSMRMFLDGSKRVGTSDIKGEAAQAFLAIPQVHGPACDSITAALKTAELELNSSEIASVGADGIGLDPSQMLLAAQSVSSSLYVVARACAARCVLLQADATTSVLPAVNSMYDFSGVEQQVQSLVGNMHQELTLALDALAAAEQEAGEKVEKVRGGGGGGDADQNPNKPAVDETSWTPAQKAKAEAARKKKEEKAAAKNAGKKKGGLALGAGSGMLHSYFKGAANSEVLMALNPYDTGDKSAAALCSKIIEDLNSGGKKKPKTAKGTRDYGPEQMRIREQVFQTIRRVFKRHGGVEIDTPVFELKEILMGKYGEDTKLIYDLADQGGELLALRYDLTVPFARFLAMNSVGNIKRYHIAKVYRRDQPQMNRGRYREFYQCDFDIAGTYPAMTADAEAITLATEILTTLPVGNICVKINHRVLLDAVFELAGVPLEKFRPICSAVDKLDKETWEEVSREMVEEKGISREMAEKIGAFVLKTSKTGKPQELWQQMMDEKTFGDHAKANAAMLEMRDLFTYLEAMGSVQFVSFDMSLARGLDYYTGLIYEIVVLDGTTAVGSIAAGGRYDNLVGMFSASGMQTPCVGISIGIERVFTIMEKKAIEKKVMSADIVQCYVASIGANTLTHRMKIAQQLWKADISTEYSVKENPKLKSQMDDCLERGIPYMAIFGESEMNSGVVKLKDMRAHTETDVKLKDLVAALIAAGCSTVGEESSKFLDSLKD